MPRFLSSCSFGKDSLATIILAMLHNEPLDEAVYCEVMFDDTISGEIPEYRDFIYNIAIPRLEAWGIKTTVLRSKTTYVSSFLHPISRGVGKGKIRSFPLCGKCCIQRDCKLVPINAYKKSLPDDVVQYIGFASDEQDRLMRLDGKTRVSLLQKYNVTEQEAFEICHRERLLSPIYEFANRNGCFFCPNAKRKELRHLYDHHPHLWGKMLELQALPNKATERFNRSERFSDIDEHFRNEDAQCTLYKE